MSAVVKRISPEAPLSKSIINPGDVLKRINCNPINDVLDYEYYSYDSELLLEFSGIAGSIKLVSIQKPEGSDLGIEFENYLMDNERHCANNCIFCFIDQLPKGMRKSLYYKDDDIRLSFLQGNYVTLTNLTRCDIKRIIKLRISPVNVSVHTLDPELRSYMLGGVKGGRGVNTLKILAKAGIELNCQIVCCPGVNDGQKLSETIEGLLRLGSSIKSVSVVPVGLTKHREGLTQLRSFDGDIARQTIRIVEYYGKRCLKKRGTRVFYCADELFFTAGLKLPGNDYYEDYPQLENGVGMMRLFITEFQAALKEISKEMSKDTLKNVGLNRTLNDSPVKISIVTGVLAGKYLTNLLKTTNEICDKIDWEIFAIRNNFFGESVNVSGLVTGRDIIDQLKDKQLGSGLLIPKNMLRAGEDVFLDDITVSELSGELGVPVHTVEINGAELLRTILKSRES